MVKINPTAIIGVKPLTEGLHPPTLLPLRRLRAWAKVNALPARKLHVSQALVTVRPISDWDVDSPVGRRPANYFGM